MAWLIIGIIVVFIIWLFVAFWGAGADRAAVPAPGTPGMMGDATGPGAAMPGSGDAAAAGAITRLEDIRNAENPAALVGRQVRLEDVEFQGRAGKGFWIGEGDERILVMVPQDGTVNLANWKPGTEVHVSGTIDRVPPGAARDWEVDAIQAGDLERRNIYIRATNVTPAE
jgi:hypothetical protein